MNKEKKLEILNRLAKDGYITLDEALILLETEKEYVHIPTNNINPWQSIPSFPPPNNSNPYTNSCDWTYRPDLITYGSTSLIPSTCNTVTCISNNCICKK